MNETLEQVGTALKSKSEAAAELHEKIEGDKGASDAQVKTWSEELDGLVGEIKTLNRQYDHLHTYTQAQQNLTHLAQPVGRHTHSGGPATKSFGEQFVGSQEFTAWFKSVAPSGSLPTSLRVPDSQSFVLNSSIKSLLTGTTTWSPRSDVSASALVPLDQRGLLDMGYWMRPLRIADLVSRGETTGDTIEYARLTGVTNAAAPVAEATATGGASGAKPESSMAFEVIHDRVKTIAHWLAAARRALSDAAQLRTLIDTFLRYGLEEELEDQIISGSGSGENFTGIRTVSGTLTQAYATDILVTSRKSITNLLLNGRVTPNAWVMHPNDWEDFDLLKDNEARYYWGGPASMGAPRLWGVPVVQSEAAVEGEAILADWKYAMLWDREQTTIRVSDSHSDFFTRNLIAILGEMRAGFGIIRPKAFLKADLTP